MNDVDPPIGLVTSQGSVTDVSGRRSYHKDGTGNQTIFTWQGDYPTMRTRYDGFPAPPWVCDLVQDGAGLWKLTATINVSVDSPFSPIIDYSPTISWNLSYKIENKELLNSDLPGINTIPDFIGEAITNSLKNKSSDLLLSTLAAARTAGQITLAQSDEAFIAYNHMRHGFGKFPTLVPILTKTATASGDYDIQWDIVNAGLKIYTTDKLIQLEDVEEELHAVLPRQIYRNGDPLKTIQLQYGWLKEFVEKDVTNRSRKIVTQRWTYGLYPTHYFSFG